MYSPSQMATNGRPLDTDTGTETRGVVGRLRRQLQNVSKLFAGGQMETVGGMGRGTFGHKICMLQSRPELLPLGQTHFIVLFVQPRISIGISACIQGAEMIRFSSCANCETSFKDDP